MVFLSKDRLFLKESSHLGGQPRSCGILQNVATPPHACGNGRISRHKAIRLGGMVWNTASVLLLVATLIDLENGSVNAGHSPLRQPPTKLATTH